ncbi:hypothetical protein GCM10023091_43560 [Ravibacter arvi]|uniref:Glycosyltransferase n=1 Tax=Ravibacter arvi TaxID=2051041 RepID=A0ABP8MEN3_9BACT
MTLKEKSVDAVVNVYGKPYQTAVTLLSLLEHSGKWIDKIYFVEERKQPNGADFQFILDLLGDRIVYYKPKVWLWVNKMKARRLLMKTSYFRNAVRYQYGWERSDKEFLLILHNDVLFTGDLVGQYLHNIGESTGIGRIGQCWNCPAFAGNLCTPETYTAYRPDYNEIMEIAGRHAAIRKDKYKTVVDKTHPWPLPECRLNEYVAMVSLKKARPDTAPLGTAQPFGSYNIVDLGIEWFHAMNNLGHRFSHFDYDPYAIHSWISLKNAGHDALFNQDLYLYEENIAKDYLRKEFDLSV